MGLRVDKEGSVWQNGSHINDQFITACQGREKRKEREKENVSRRPLRRLTSCQERRGILTSSCWLLTITCDWSRGEYRWVSKPCLDWTERTWRGHCVVKSRSGLGGMSKRQWKFFQWSKDTKSKVKMFKWEKGGGGGGVFVWWLYVGWWKIKQVVCTFKRNIQS